MPDLDSALATITGFADSPPFAAAPQADVERRARTRQRRRRARRSGVAAVAVVVALAAGAVGLRGGDEGTGRLTTDTTLPTVRPVDPDALLDQVIDTIDEHAFHTNPSTIARWRDEAAPIMAEAAATPPGDTRTDPHTDPELFVRSMLGELQRNFAADLGRWTAASYRRDWPGAGQTSLRPLGEVRNGVGYLTLPPIGAGPASSAGTDYIATAHDALTMPACGWVIDQRALGSDVRSDLATMLAALAPVLGPGPTVGYRDRHGATRTYVVADDGSMTFGEETVAPAPDGGVSFTDAPVAVIQGPATRWSWEGLVIGFRGRPATRTFGSPTGGLTMGTEQFPLDDGSTLVLTTGVAVDRAGNVYGGATPIEPDEPHAATRAQTQAATTWITGQATCGAASDDPLGDELEDLTRETDANAP
jgi:carboxyl-terminal processing protease